VRVVIGGLVVAVLVGACGGGGTGTTHASVATSTTVRPPARVKVLVINGSGVQGAAARMADKLRGLGYTVVGVGNAPRQTTTAVACRAGFVTEAAQLANAVGAGTRVVPFPNPPPSGVGDADCIVGLGT
jgi:hypothetical protein